MHKVERDGHWTGWSKGPRQVLPNKKVEAGAIAALALSTGTGTGTGGGGGGGGGGGADVTTSPSGNRTAAPVAQSTYEGHGAGASGTWKWTSVKDDVTKACLLNELAQSARRLAPPRGGLRFMASKLHASGSYQDYHNV